LLTQVGSGTFFANNGSATAPSFSFTTDTTTGMYLVSTGQLGLTANGQRMMLFNNSSVGNPLITTPANFTATGGINGGSF